MQQYHIYIEVRKDSTTGKEYKTRRYYQAKLKNKPEKLTYVGTAKLSKDYFIVGCETQYTDIVSLDDIEVQYTASLRNGRISTFKHSVQELLERAKEGLLPYLSFTEHKVKPDTKIIIKGKLHEVKKPVDLTVDLT